jgi:hypothetical protein
MSLLEMIKISAGLLFGATFLIIIPAAIHTLFSRKPQWFTGKTISLWICGIGFLSWCLVNALWFVPMVLGLRPIEGPEAAMALLFGWFYIYLAAIPYCLISAVIVLIRKIFS